MVLMAQGKDVQSLLPGIQEMVRAGIDVTLVIDTHRKDKVSVEVPGCSPILVLQTCWLLKRPTRAFLRNFDNNDGDVLIDVSISKSLPLLYLAVRSRSIFKIGVSQRRKQSVQFANSFAGVVSPGRVAEMVIPE